MRLRRVWLTSGTEVKRRFRAGMRRAEGSSADLSRRSEVGKLCVLSVGPWPAARGRG
jgi:hypothetical protein